MENSELREEYKPRGRERLWLWFSLSYASWLTMPRVMMHAMPDEWQDRMAALLEEWDAHWDSSDMPNTRVQAVGERGRITRFPSWLLNYRHPDRRALNALLRLPAGEPGEAA